MTRLNLLPYRDLAKIDETAGFHWVRCRGTHNTFRSPDGRVVVIPDHSSQAVVPPLLRRIIRDLGLTVNEYDNLVESL